MSGSSLASQGSGVHPLEGLWSLVITLPLLWLLHKGGTSRAGNLKVMSINNIYKVQVRPKFAVVIHAQKPDSEGYPLTEGRGDLGRRKYKQQSCKVYERSVTNSMEEHNLTLIGWCWLLKKTNQADQTQVGSSQHVPGTQVNPVPGGNVVVRNGWKPIIITRRF